MRVVMRCSTDHLLAERDQHKRSGPGLGAGPLPFLFICLNARRANQAPAAVWGLVLLFAVERAVGSAFGHDRLHDLFREFRLFDQPIPYRGRQGFFNVPADTILGGIVWLNTQNGGG